MVLPSSSLVRVARFLSDLILNETASSPSRNFPQKTWIKLVHLGRKNLYALLPWILVTAQAFSTSTYTLAQRNPILVQCSRLSHLFDSCEPRDYGGRSPQSAPQHMIPITNIWVQECQGILKTWTIALILLIWNFLTSHMTLRKIKYTRTTIVHRWVEKGSLLFPHV